MQVFPQFKCFWDKKIPCKVGQCKTATAKSKPIEKLEDELEMSTLKEAIPDHDFVNFKNKEELKKWLESSNINQHLVLQDYLDTYKSFGYNSKVSGMEFQSMIYLSSICLKCGVEFKSSCAITRAKASLLLAKYERQNCPRC